MKYSYWKRMISVVALTAMVSMSFTNVSFAAAEGDVQEESVEETTDESKDDAEEKEETKEEAKDDKETSEKNASKKDWTVMIYMCATDLESMGGQASFNLDEISKTEPSDSVNVVIQTGGTRKWQTDTIDIGADPTKTQRFEYGKDGFVLVDEKPLQNMASGYTLSDFITWSTKTYPAEKYMLVMWDHGGGSEVGLICDELHDNSLMTLYDMESALKRAGTEFELIVTDCCLMATIEMCSCVKNYAKYLAASEEVLAGEGTAYTGWLQFLYDVPECDGREIGNEFCDVTTQKYVEEGDESTLKMLTFSVIDLSEIDEVEQAFDAFFDKALQLVHKPEEYSKFRYYTEKAEHYGGKGSNLVDIVDLAKKTRRSGVITTEANNLQKAVMKAVKHNVKGTGRSYSHGLSYYDGTRAFARNLERFARVSKSCAYLAYLDSVHMDWDAPDWVYENRKRVPDITYDEYHVDTKLTLNDEGDLTLNVTNGMQGIVSIDYVLYKIGKDGSLEPMGTRTEMGGSFDDAKFPAQFNGKWPVLGNSYLYMELENEAQSCSRYSIPVYVEKVDPNKYNGELPIDYMQGQIMKLLLAYFPGDGDDEASYELYGFLKSDYEVENTEIPSRGTWSLKDFEGVTISFLYPDLDPITKNFIYKKGEAIEITRNLHVEEKNLPSGTYGYSYVIQDVIGNTISTETVPFTLKDNKAVYDFEEEEEAEEVEETEEDAN